MRQREWPVDAAIGPSLSILAVATFVAATVTAFTVIRARRVKVLSCRIRIDSRLDGNRLGATTPDSGIVVEFTFPERPVVSADAPDSNPPSLAARRFQPSLSTPGDSFTLVVLLSGNNGLDSGTRSAPADR